MWTNPRACDCLRGALRPLRALGVPPWPRRASSGLPGAPWGLIYICNPRGVVYVREAYLDVKLDRLPGWLKYR
jgi:hypothetical protein